MTVTLGYSYSPANAQDSKIGCFIGLNPGVTVEPDYAKGEMDVSIVPLVYQRPVTNRLHLRLISVVNYGVRNTGNQLSQIGMDTALPVFLGSGKNSYEPPKGFYVAPVISLTRNRMDGHNALGLWTEAGYHFLFKSKVAIMFGLQFGATHFAYDDDQTKWGSHFGVEFIIGRWL